MNKASDENSSPFLQRTGFSRRFCVIGAGPCGLAAVKNFSEAGLEIDCWEREHDLGGNWQFGTNASSVHEATHLISSKRLTQFVGFPMPDDYPHYPSHERVLAYLRSYADRFRLRDHIRFNTSVKRIERSDDGQWRVELDNDPQPQFYAGIVIANGHHWDPFMPELQGEFHGEILHARQCKTSRQFEGRRVLVIGGGNSGCDLAVEAARHAEAAFLSLRRGYHFLPKFLMGAPIDLCGHSLMRWRVPLALRRQITSAIVSFTPGKPERFGLPAPDHKLFETHPIVNSQLLYYAGHGDLAIRPQVARLCGREVEFIDGQRERIDLIVCATGYKLSFPFIDSRYLNWREGRPQLFMNAFHPDDDTLFVAGMIQPNSGIWALADWQTQLMAAFLVAQSDRPDKADWFRKLKRRGADDLSGGIRYVESARHAIEVEYYSYAQRLKKLIRTMRG